MIQQRSSFFIALLIACLFATAASACRIPVFRYALERWPPGSFELVILHAGELTTEQSELVRSVADRSTDKDSPVNLRVTTIDVTAQSISPEDQILLAATSVDPETVTAPQATLLFPRTRGETTIAWRGDLTATEMDRLLDSPVRQQTIERLLAGDSAVWILIEGPDKAANEAAAERLEIEIARVAEEIKLPPQEILQAEEEFDPTTAIELRIGFSVLRIRRDDPQEGPFREILLNSESDLASFDEPIAIPVFGRGRTYYALVGKGIKPGLIEANCRFICGDCSCQVKEENPGSDLLFAANWEEGIRGTAFPDQVLPELTGIGSLDVIDLAEYERQVASTDGGSESVADAIEADAVEADAVDKSDVSEVATTSDNSDTTHADSVAVPAAADEASPLWFSLLPAIGLALLVAITGIFLLRS